MRHGDWRLESCALRKREYVDVMAGYISRDNGRLWQYGDVVDDILRGQMYRQYCIFEGNYYKVSQSIFQPCRLDSRNFSVGR